MTDSDKLPVGRLSSQIVIGPALKDLRKAGGMDQKQFSELIGAAPQWVCQVETGSRRVGLNALLKISQRTGVPLSRIIAQAEKYARRLNSKVYPITE